MYDTVIIGAGMSGLAAGIRLAHYNKRVCILERHKMVGGLNSYYQQSGRNYDVGLHAITNYAQKGTKTGPLSRLLRHLRFKWEELALVPQIGSTIAFPGVSLRFANDIALFESEIARNFPVQIDGFRKMIGELIDYNQIGMGTDGGSAREFVARHISDPLLTEMLFCPLLYYGGARENDMEFAQFCIMFRSIFLEGFARPYQGVRLILQKLLQKFKGLGGELRLRAGVTEILSRNGRAEKLLLEDGGEIHAKQFLSSAGWRETMRLCYESGKTQEQFPAGRLSFVETISVLRHDPKKLGHDRTIVFYNDSPSFVYEKPDSLVDVRSGVICSPNNFDYAEPLGEGMIRITALANYDRWASLDEKQYRLEKMRWYDRMIDSAVRFVPDFRNQVIDTDMFTPLTIRRFTGHENGAVYGAPEKKYDGRTHLDNLYVCGTDQGMVGVVGSLVSGVTIANKYLLGGE
ncbi:MAG: NAD(P)/FAD-dependent oxidoreductase [Planctomycetaceae bacterium]|jgi:phytoene dehydrogenase-like protein|nr:NAD(P)/FAD-dependent oxidoreductase [Planctomycetaceae bacterium]